MGSFLRCAALVGAGTMLEALRNRILLVGIGFALVLVGLSMSAAAVSFGERARLIVDVGLAAASGLGTVVALALSVSSFGREIAQRTAYPILVRPLPRSAFVLGKFLGLWAAVIAVVTVMIAATAGLVILFGAPLPPAFWPSLYLASLEVGVVVSVSLLFSSLAVPVLAATYSAGVLLAGQLSEDLLRIAENLAAKGDAKADLIQVAYYVFPNLQDLSLRIEAANNLPVPAGFLGYATLYAFGYMSVVLLIAMVVFSRRRVI